MAKKILSGATVKVENMSGFDKSRLNLLTTHVGTLTPIVKQLMLPGNFKFSLDLHSKLPPLAFDAYLRSHLKVEAFFVPMRLCYGGFESWFCGKEMYDPASDSFIRAKLPRLFFSSYADSELTSTLLPEEGAEVPTHGGVGSLLDYFGVNFKLASGGTPSLSGNAWQTGPIETTDESSAFYGVSSASSGLFLSIFPHVAYALIYDEWYRNKLVQRPLFAPIDSFVSSSQENLRVAHLPFSSFKDIKTVVDHFDYFWGANSGGADNFDQSVLSDMLLDGKSIFELRQRNYGDDYFTVASPNAQEDLPSVVSTSGNYFTISSLRAQNAMQEFKELNNFASPDYRQTMTARYGVSPSAGVAQKPILLGSADYPFFTQGVENNSTYSGGDGSLNPFIERGLVGSKAGVATANGSQFICSGKVDEPGYLIVLASFVPEANYASGIAHDMTLFTEEGSLVDLPVGILEHVGNEPVFAAELTSAEQLSDVFGYVQRYLWHKAGSASNEVHGLFRKGMSLAAAVPQRDFSASDYLRISSDFLRIRPSDLDGITAASADLSNFGIMLDCSVNLFVSEPLCESALPSLSNPASEHGKSVYLKHGGSKLS